MKRLLSFLMLLVASTAMSLAQDTWTVAGTAAALNGTADWTPTNTENDMTSEDGTNYTLTVTNCTLEKGVTYQYKVVKNHDWSVAYPSNNKTFTVSETAVYTVVYSFNATTHDVSETTTKTGTAGELTHTYSVAGSPASVFGAAWDQTSTATDMQQGADGLYTWKKDGVELAANTKIEFKVVVDHSWGQAYPASNKVVTIPEDGTYDLTFAFDATSKEVNCNYEKKGEANIEAFYILAGSSDELFGTTWDAANEANKMEKTSDGVYSKTYTGVVLPAGEIEWKVVQNGSTWIPEGEGNNNVLTIPETGSYDVTFTYSIATDEMTANAEFKGSAVITTTFIVAGSSETLFGSPWDGTIEANKMEKNAEGIWEKSYTNVTLTAGMIEWKVVKNGATWIPDGGNLAVIIPEDGTYDVIFTYNEGKTPASKLFKDGKEIIPEPSTCEGWPANYPGVMLQGFYWNSFEDTKLTELQKQVDDISTFFDLVWLPNTGATGGTGMGYLPVYWLNHNSNFGRQNTLKKLIAEFNKRGTKVIEDVVLNHKAPKGANDSWVDFVNETWKHDGITEEINWTPADICRNDDGGWTNHVGDSLRISLGEEYGWTCTGADDTGDDFSGGRDLDHTGANVQKNCITYLNFLQKEIGYSGYRLDMVKGYSAYYTKIYNEATKPEFCVGEYWSGKEAITNWISGTGMTSAAFDFPFKYQVKDAFDGGNWSALDWKGIAEDTYWQRYAVTFIDNHDTYENEGRQVHNVLAANAFMLAMPGTPCVFLKHWQKYPIAIGNMILARKAAGITNQSAIVDGHSEGGGYVLKVQGSNGTVLCIAGFVQMDTTGFKLIASGDNFAYFVSDNITVEGLREGSDDEEAKEMTVYVECTEAPYIYSWNSAGQPTNGTWPGTQLTNTVTKEDGKTFWTRTFATVPVNIVINNGGDKTTNEEGETIATGENMVQTADIKGLTHDSYFTFDPTNSDKETNWTDITSNYYTPEPVELPACAKPIENHVYCYFQGNKDYDSPRAWVWNEGKNFCGEWPGAKLTRVGDDGNGHLVWLWDGGDYVDLFDTYTPDPTQFPTNVLFNNGGEDPKTADFKFENGGYYDATGLLGNVNTPTAISNVPFVVVPTQQTYNLSGQRVTNNYRGIVVREGKKLIVR